MLELKLAGGKYKALLKDMGHAQMQAKKMARMIAAGDLPITFRPNLIDFSRPHTTREQKDEWAQLDVKFQLESSNKVLEFAKDDTARFQKEAEELVQKTTELLNRPDVTDLGLEKLAQEWDVVQTKVIVVS